MKPVSSASHHEEESLRFVKSLQELEGLQSQLRDAADYCETTFLESKVKREVLKNTKEYLCGAMVTVVDHLGNVSANLESLISQANTFCEAESHINCLKQRVLTCEQYAHTLALSKVQWSENLPRFHSRYLSSSSVYERSNSEKWSSSEQLRDTGSEVPSKIKDMLVLEEEDLPLFMYTQKPCPNFNLTTTTAKGTTNLTLDVIPVQDMLTALTKIPNQKFHFQMNQKAGRHRKSLRSSDMSWLIRHKKKSQ